MASHSHNADPSTATASSASLVLPSFTQSRTYTYESEDANSRCSDAYTNNTNNYEDDNDNDNTSMASEGMASASTANTANMSSPGGTSKSARYKSAMTSRARQRRIRRMKERNGNGSNSAVDTSGDSVSVNTPNGGGLLAPNSPNFPGTPNTPTGSTTTPISTNNTPTNNSPARVQQAKEHVEQMKLYQEQMRPYRSSSSSPNHQQQQSGAPGTPTVLQPTRLLEKSRNRSFGSRGGGSRDPSPSPTPYSPSEVVISNNTAGPHHSASAATASGARVAVSSVSNTPQRSNSTNSNRASASPSTRSSGNDLISSYTKSATSKKKKEQKSSSSSSYRPNTTDFIPNWSIESPGDNGMLNPEEVQNAANYTSIKFQYSTMSGATAGEGGSPGTEEGLEVFSDDGTHQYDDDRTADTGSVLSGSVFSGHYGNTSGRNTPLGMVGDLQNATHHPAQQEQQAAESTATTNNNKQTWQNDVWSEATTPTILQGNEIFHQKAAASIVSLLSPNRMLGAGLMAPTISDPNYQDESSKDVDADSPTGIIPLAGNKESMRGMFTFDSDGDPSSSRGGEWRGMTQVNRTLFRREDLDEDVKQSMIFQAFRQNMMQPSVQLSELLTQIHRRGGVSIDRAFATRRKNACGALKILSAKEENRMKICWTLGVLPAIASVLSDVSEGISDDISLAANTEARNRIVSTLLNLSVSKKNRMLIVNTPGVLESMVQTIQYDTGESRQGCCTVLLYLAKTTECRSMLVKSAGMMEALSKVIEVPKEEVVNNKKKSTRKNSIKSRLLASAPVSPLGPGSPGESTLDDTINTGRSSYHSDISEDDDDSHSSHSGSHSSSGSHSGASRDDEDGNDESVASNVPIEEVDQMEISFQTAETTLVQNTTLDTTKKFAEGEDDEEVKDDFYDADPNRFLHGARLSIFACLLCCVKSKENAVSFIICIGYALVFYWCGLALLNADNICIKLNTFAVHTRTRTNHRRSPHRRMSTSCLSISLTCHSNLGSLNSPSKE